MIKLRNKIISFLYQKTFKKLAFRADPEDVHDNIINFGKFLGSNFLTRGLVSLFFNYKNTTLEQKILGINFSNPIGLSAGFDKNAELTKILPEVGFGFAELGSITGEPCEGNPKPRLWRLPKSKSLVVYYGLKNDGAEAISKRLANKKFKIPMVISIAKTNCKKTVDVNAGIEDYLKAYQAFDNIGAYYTINISCPNAFGGEPFSDPEKLELLLEKIIKLPKTKPIFIKLSPDLSENNIDQIIDLAIKYNIDGFICSNLTKKRENKNIIDKDVPEVGGISGKVVESLANDLISYIYKKTNGQKIIIGVGGVFTAEDAYKKIKMGASLIQIITGMIFNGPGTISDINLGLVKLLEKDGYKNISEAIGQNNKK